MRCALLPPRRALAPERRAAAASAARRASREARGRSRAGSRRGRASRRRRRAARGAATCRACAAGCTRAARARPGACPRRSARAGRRCRGSAASGRRRAPERVLERALLRRAELVVDEQHLGVASRRTPAFSSASFPLPTNVRGSGRARCWTSSPTGATPGGARELAELGELVVAVRRPSGTRRRGTRAPAPPRVRDRAGAQSRRDYAAVRSLR